MLAPDALGRLLGDAEFAAAMERATAAFERYRERLPIIPFAYSRSRLLLDARFEIVAMRWAPGAVSPIHDHGASRCWVLMLDGTLEVENFTRHDGPEARSPMLSADGRITLGRGDVDHRLAPTELHRVRNVCDVSAYSLQLYAAPIATYSVYDERTGQPRDATANCDVVLDLATL